MPQDTLGGLPRGAVREVPLRPYRRHRWLDPLSQDFVEAYRRAHPKIKAAWEEADAAASAVAHSTPQGDLPDALD